MSEPSMPPRLSEVLRLATLLSDRALDAQIMGRPIPDDQVVALTEAARLLQDHGVEWPPLLAQVLHEMAAGMGEQLSEPTPDAEMEAAADLQGLSRFFAGFRKAKAEP